MSQQSDRKIIRVKLSQVVPYWRNPRHNELAIEKVVESIKEYGYQSLIIVDENLTIIVGHSRYKALQILGYDEIDVQVSDMPAKKAKEYRLIDNRTSEYATWSPELVLEVKEFADMDVAKIFFPDVTIQLDYKPIDMSPVTAESVQQQGERLVNEYKDADVRRAQRLTEVTCPNCGEEFAFTGKNVTDVD